MKRLLALFLLCAVRLYAQQGVQVLFGSGVPSGGVAFTPGAHYVDNSVNPAVTYICTSVSVAAGPSPPAGTQTCNWTQLGGSGSSSPSSIPGEAGVTALPFITSPAVWMADYRIFPTETAGGILDYTGNGNNATGSVGTSPTIIPVTGGLQCNANGAVKLPAAVNGAKDIFIYMGYQSNFPGTPGSATFTSPLLGNGNGTTSNAAGLIIANYGMNTNYTQYANSVMPVANGVVTNNSFNGVNGTFLLEWVMDTIDHEYINGVEIQYDNDDGGNGTSAGINTFPFQVCGAAAGSGLGTQTYMTGQIYEIAMASTPLNSSDRANATNYILNAWTKRGVPPLQQLTTISTDTVDFVGDSMLTGTGNAASLANNVPHTVALNGTWTVINDTFPGATMAGTSPPPSNSAAAAGTQLFQQFLQPLAQRNVIVTMLGTNDDCARNLSAAVFGAAQAKFIRNAKSIGFRVLIATIPSCQGGGADVTKNAYNTQTRNMWRAWGADGLVDVAADPNLGADAAAANTTYFLDGVHWTANGAINNATPIFQRAINRLFGNTDFSTATVYASAAAAAVATTAGSEATNTMTFTFGATPANCQVGNTIVIAGTTPAGYSNATGWTILTRSATQVTAWNNTTGLGAISVQGTGVCPQQQDADQYMVLNFGNGNFTLESCQGYTGQNIYIRNINAASSTLAPFASETITGIGASSTTLAATSTAILQSQLVSAAAGGCNWVRLQ